MSDSFAKIICDSISPEGIRITTVHMRYWRGIHAELMTHRVFSRNARSSRAVPISKMIEEVRNDPFIPKHWGKNQKGMQADEECNELVTIGEWQNNSGPIQPFKVAREEAWKYASRNAIIFAENFAKAGYHKQIVNRLLEPFMWIDTLVTSTEWANFFALRQDKDAEPHFRDLANQVKQAMDESKPIMLQPDMWHLPYITDSGWLKNSLPGLRGVSYKDKRIVEIVRKISAARCARISYKPFDGNDTVEAELDRYDKLVNSGLVHASPVEHQATPDWMVYNNRGEEIWANPYEHRNFYGWRQHRALIPRETIYDKRS